VLNKEKKIKEKYILMYLKSNDKEQKRPSYPKIKKQED
jgi:hypothetical protein